MHCGTNEQSRAHRHLPSEAAMRRGRLSAMETLASTFSRLGIQIDGNRAWDIQIHDAAVPVRIVSQGYFGLAESYADGGWDCVALDSFFERLYRAQSSYLPSWHVI